jgi:ribosomal protein S18 acetylase RimI-like enzyme
VARLPASLTVRRGGPSDRAFVLDLGRRTADASVSTLRTPSQELLDSSYERLVEFAFERSYLLLLAETDLEGPLGFLLMLEDLPDEVTALPQGFVAYMAVEPDARRRGIAATLLAAAENSARERGLPFMALMVTEDNAAARELYAQAGYATERRLLCKML